MDYVKTLSVLALHDLIRVRFTSEVKKRNTETPNSNPTPQ